MKKELRILFAIVSAAILVRVLVLWVTRPEFVGWFNHTYYYYVQVRGLIEQGELPFRDMPLLFYLYGFTAKILNSLGIGTNEAIVASTRLWMSIIPAMIAIPVFSTLRSIGKQSRLSREQWGLVLAAAFLPLSISHIPEFLQKNALGLLLLVLLISVSRKILIRFKFKEGLISVGLILLIVLTHFGTIAAMLLYGFAVLAASIIIRSGSKRNWWIVLIFSFILLLSMGLIFFFDTKRFDRVFIYLRESIHLSLLGSLISPETGVHSKILALAGILIPAATTTLLYRAWRRHSEKLSAEDRNFWLVNIIFCYLLVLPVYDQLLMARFVLFLSLPLLFVLSFTFSFVIQKAWLRTGLAALILFGSLFMAFGEIMSLRFHNRDKEEVFADLMALREALPFQANDLILTKNGAEHICNWFLGTKAGMITSLNKSDFYKYDNIYVLNPIEGELNFQGLDEADIRKESGRYLFMMRNILKPDSAKIIFESDHIQFFKLPAPAPEWTYDREGNWMGYSD